MLIMNTADYINAVCASNRLRETAEWLTHSSENVYHADRHVAEPPENVSGRAACTAGLSLLIQWTNEAAALQADGIFASKPILIIDQEWLDELPEAPPPHILVTLTKRLGSLPREEMLGKAFAHTDCPISDLLTGPLSDITVIKIEPSEERESLGGWLFKC